MQFASATVRKRVCYANFDYFRRDAYPDGQFDRFTPELIEADLCNYYVFAYAWLENENTVRPRHVNRTVDIDLYVQSAILYSSLFTDNRLP